VEGVEYVAINKKAIKTDLNEGRRDIKVLNDVANIILTTSNGRASLDRRLDESEVRCDTVTDTDRDAPGVTDPNPCAGSVTSGWFERVPGHVSGVVEESMVEAVTGSERVPGVGPGAVEESVVEGGAGSG
jgi:hypothetical protein